MSDEEIIELCREVVMELPQSYTVGDWIPHPWVIEAIRRAYMEGRDDG